MRSQNHVVARSCGCSSMVEHELPKLDTRVRFPSPAPLTDKLWYLRPARLLPLFTRSGHHRSWHNRSELRLAGPIPPYSYCIKRPGGTA